MDQILPWEVLMEPYLLGLDVAQAEEVDVLRAIDKPEYLVQIINHRRFWSEHGIEKLSKERVTEIFDRLCLPDSIIKLVHPNNFIQPQSGYVATTQILPLRIIYSTDLTKIMKQGGVDYDR